MPNPIYKLFVKQSIYDLHLCAFGHPCIALHPNAYGMILTREDVYGLKQEKV